ncbi:MAG: flippase [Gammaproteobacteria bacterium]|nr:flippase [Gammaproteobacteria bacterium]
MQVGDLSRRRLYMNVVSLYAIQGLNYLSPIVVLPFVLRALSTEGYGTVVLVQSLMSYVVLFTDFGYNLTAARDISLARADPRAVARVFWTTSIAKSLLFLGSMSVVVLVVVCVPLFRAQMAIVVVSALLPLGSVMFPQWYFQGLERLTEASLAQAGSKILLAAAIILVVRRPADAWLCALLMAAPQALGALVALAIPGAPRPPPFVRPAMREIAASIRGSVHMFGSTLATTLYGRTTVVALGLFCGTHAVAIYNVGTRFVAALQSLATPVTQAIYPRVASLLHSAPREAWNLIQRTARWLTLLVGTATLILAVGADSVVRLAAGPGYAGAVTVLRISAFTAVAISAIAVPCQMVIVSVELTRPLLRVYLIAGVLNLCLLPLLLPTWGANGAAVCFLVAECVATLLMMRLVWIHRAQAGGAPPGQIARISTSA